MLIFTTSKQTLNLHPQYRTSDLISAVTKTKVVLMAIVVATNEAEIITMVAVTTTHGNAVDVSEMK